jgi:hypothetical protein
VVREEKQVGKGRLRVKIVLTGEGTSLEIDLADEPSYSLTVYASVH